MRETAWSMLIYVLAGLSSVGIALYVGFYHPHYDPPWRWIEFGVVTTIVFTIAVKAFWCLRRSTKFWLTLLGLLSAHVAIFAFPLGLYTDNWTLLAKVATFSCEAMFLVASIHFITGAVPYSGSSR